MKKPKIELLTLVLLCALAAFAGEQQNPSDNNAQNSQDVPHQQPGTNNPNLQQQKKPAPNTAPQQGSGSSNPSQKSADVPHQGPGTNNPDVANQHNKSSSDTSAAQHGKKKGKRKQQSSTPGQT